MKLTFRGTAFLLALCLFFFLESSFAQKKAVTDTGDEVILYDNGTWKYANPAANEEKPIETNPNPFARDKSATFLLKSNRIHTGFWLDSKKWKFYKPANSDGEYQLELKDQTMQAVIITEKIGLSLESLKAIAIKNALQVSPDFQVLHNEYRTVNGLKVLYMLAQGTVSGMKAFFYGYYYSDEESTLQYLAFGYNNLKEADKKNAEELLNGLVVLDTASSNSKTAPPLITNIPDENTAVVPQGIYSPNNQCKKYFSGKWFYSYKDTNVVVERTLEKTTEYIGKDWFEYRNKWINNCEYQMIFTKTSKRGYTSFTIGDSLDISIMEIDDKIMRYRSNYKNMEVEGEMSREIAKKM
ncbi:MAG: hypothetical protein ABI359_11525 [Ginsengibacter sp.]